MRRRVTSEIDEITHRVWTLFHRPAKMRQSDLNSPSHATYQFLPKSDTQRSRINVGGPCCEYEHADVKQPGSNMRQDSAVLFFSTCYPPESCPGLRPNLRHRVHDVKDYVSGRCRTSNDLRSILLRAGRARSGLQHTLHRTY